MLQQRFNITTFDLFIIPKHVNLIKLILTHDFVNVSYTILIYNLAKILNNLFLTQVKVSHF